MRSAEQQPRSRCKLLSDIVELMAKDLRVEWRSREIITTMVFFAVLIVMVFSFAFAREGQPMHPVAAGILWVAVPFVGLIGLGRLFEREREADTYRALLLCPIDRAAIYLAKLLGTTLFICCVEAVVLPLLVLLFALPVPAPLLLLGLLVLGTLGFAAVGTLFGAGLMQSRSRDVLLGILLFPIVTPVIIAGAKGTAALLTSPPDAASAWLWLKLLAAFDAVFIALSLAVFEPLTRSE